MGLRSKISLLFLLLCSAILLIGIPYAVVELNRIKKDNYEAAAEGLRHELDICLSSKKDVWLTNALLIANNPIIRRALETGERQGAFEMLDEYSRIFRTNTNFNNVQIHLIDRQGRSFVKSWDSGSFGEELSYSRAYAEVLETEEPLVTMEESPKGLRLKGLFPIFAGKTMVGLCNFEGGLNSIKRDFEGRRGEFLYLLDSAKLGTAQKLATAPTLWNFRLSQKDYNPDFLEYMASLDDIPVLNRVRADRDYLTLLLPVEDSTGKQIGLYVLGQKTALADKAVVRDRRLLLGMLGAMMLVISLMVLLTTLFLGRTVLTPVKMLLRISRNLAEGDLSLQVPALRSKDEFQNLLQGYNHAIDSLKGLIGKVQESSLKNESENAVLINEIENTTNSSYEINLSSLRTGRAMEELDGMIQGASSAVEEISANIRSLAGRIGSQTSAVSQTTAAMEEMSASINSVAGITEKHVRSSEELAGMTTEGEEHVRRTLAQIDKINDSLEEVSSLNTIVKSVAAQTSLLAMNAAIEAAHAGDAGRGFAVVADEIRKLAESTGKSSNQISASLKTLVEDITQSVDSSRTTGELFSKINDKAQLVSHSYGEINKNTEELSYGTKDVVASAEMLLQISREIQSSIDEMDLGARDINDSLLSVKESSGEVSLRMQDIHKGIARVTASMSTVTASALGNSTSLKEILTQLSHFKVSQEDDEAQKRGNRTIYYSILMLQHIRWTTRVQAFIYDGAELDPADLPSHDSCKLGWWLREDRRDLFASSEEYALFQEEHRLFHEALYAIVENRENSSPGEMEGLYREFIGHSRRVVDGLRRLR